MTLSDLVWHTSATINSATGIAHWYHDRYDAVVVYHSVGEPDKFGNVSERRFREDIEYLQRNYTIVPLQDLVADRSPETPKHVAITFDDAHGNFFRCAYPIISAFEIPVTLFVPEAFVEGENPAVLKDRLGLETVDSETMLSVDQIRSLVDEGLVELGNHTRTHADLSMIDDADELEREIVGAKERLEDRFATSVETFAYPYGQLSDAAHRVVKRSHSIAVTSEPGLLTADRGPYHVPRVSGHLQRSRLQWELTDLAESFRKVNQRIS